MVIYSLQSIPDPDSPLIFYTNKLFIQILGLKGTCFRGLEHCHTLSKIAGFVGVDSFEFGEFLQGELELYEGQDAAEVVDVRDAHPEIDLVGVYLVEAVTHYNGVGVSGLDFVEGETHFFEAVVLHDEYHD